MIPYSYNMVDMNGIDLAEANGTVVPGIYEKITEAMNLCGDLIIYNWKFAGIEVAPSAYSVIQQGSSIMINGIIQVTELNQVTVVGLPPPIVPVSPLEVTENGLYEAELPASGFNPVRVQVPPPPIDSITITENGVYEAEDPVAGFSPVTVQLPPPVISPAKFTENGTYYVTEGVDGFNPVEVDVSGGGSLNDLLFHFDDFKNSGKMSAVFYNKTGYEISNEQSKFGGTSLKISSAPTVGGAVYFENGFSFGDQDFTLDFWMYLTNGGSSACAVSFNYRSFGYYTSAPTTRGLVVAYNSSQWSVDHGGETESLNILNAWHHVAITRDGITLRVFVDGSLEDTFEWDHSFPAMTRMSFGTNSNNSTGWRGYIDEFRLRLGVAVWTENFTPPTEPYT